MAIQRRRLLELLAGGAALAGMSPSEISAAALSEIKVYKDPSCQCCAAWVKHLQANGFIPSVEVRDDLASLKRSFGIPDALTSCHTAKVGDYVLEGHVPAREIKRLLLENPRARGLAVPGMPVGAPGMEVPGQSADPFKVLLFTDDGSQQVYASYS